MSLIYEAYDLKKYYNQVLALDIPFFGLAKGAALVLEGPNGSGKSTFLRLLAFIEQPSSGSLRYLDSSEPRMYCTLLLQDPWLLHASVFTNVTLGLRLRGIRSDLVARYNNAMTSAGFAAPEQLARRMPASLSGGERQRVALASRLILQPAVLLLDEPTAHVDAASAARIMEALRQASQKGVTIICATHDPELASLLNARKMLMKRPG